MAQGAVHFVGRADELGALSGLVAGLDRRRPGGDVTGVDALTARELEVARLIVDRNRSCSSASRRSRPTCSTCSSKLEVTSRVELARDTPEA